MSRDMSKVKAHTVKSSTYKMPESEGMMGNVHQAAQLANALSGVSPALKKFGKVVHYGSFGVGTGVLGFAVGKALGENRFRALFSLSYLGTAGGMMLLSYLTRGSNE
tara:strand:+ start:10238 stop:10558 length:321 start_codon:yes stop_codon:yes gene_type:complete